MKGPVLMSAALTVALQAIVLSWILKIEKKCPCSVDWRRDYMKYMSIIMALNTGLSVFRPDLIMMLALPLLFAGLVNIFQISRSVIVHAPSRMSGATTSSSGGSCCLLFLVS
jgi:hypothetical protein